MFIAVIVMCWLIYSLLKTQRRMEAEIREIRKRCVAETKLALNQPDVDIIQSASTKMTEGLQRLMSLAT